MRLAERAPRELLRSDITAVSDESIDLLVTSMIWGFGRRGYGPARTAKMLETEQVAEIAECIVETTRSKGARAGYSALFKPNGSGKIYGLAVAMGPKLLYFACRDENTCPLPKPVIYDQFVYAGLRKLPADEQPHLPTTGSELLPSPKRRVSSEAYQAWCGWADEHATRLGVRPEDIEHALFCEGKSGS